VKSYRILHVDDDPLMRDVVEISLGLDPGFALMTCAGGDEALAMAPGWAPDMILCDVNMPDMDGPALLARLCQDPSTAKFPVVFMTAGARAEEIARFKSLGAVGVIAKPFDPATFADTVRAQLRGIKLAASGYDFAERLRADAATLEALRRQMQAGADASLVPDGLQTCVHKLAGAAGVFNFQAVSHSAAALEDAIVERHAPAEIEAKLDALLDCIEHA